MLERIVKAIKIFDKGLISQDEAFFEIVAIVLDKVVA